MRRVFRQTTVTRVVLGALGVVAIVTGLFVIAVASFADGGDAERALTIAIALGITALGLLQLFVLRARVVADDAGVEIVNYTSRRRVAWDEIDRFEVGFAYWGITLVPRSGPPVKMNAIQKTNLYHWLGKRGRADRVVEELNALLEEHRGPAVPPPPVPPPPPPP
ncbi:MAG TPA: PH domain-containing protein [Actinomycetota bacterium]